MVICCAAPNCTNRQGKGSRGRVSFHRFPLKDPARLATWTVALQRSNWTPGPYSFLCSDHFSSDSFVSRMPDQIPLLKPNAVPSVFLNSKASKKKSVTRSHGKGVPVVKKKSVQKTPLPTIQDQAALMLPGEDIVTEGIYQTDIFDSNDLKDQSSLLMSGVSSNRPSAGKFISSLHSYSRTTVSSAPQKSGSNAKPEGYKIDIGRTEHACNEHSSSENSKDYAEIGGVFSSDVPESVDHVKVEHDHSLRLKSMVPLSLQQNESHCETSDMLSLVDADQPCYFKGLKDCFITQEQDLLMPHAINSLHSYCSPSKSLSGKQQEIKEKTWADGGKYSDMPALLMQDAPLLNPAISPLAWMLGTWVSEPAGKGEFPTITPFNYKEEAVISHAGQPMLNFTICSSNPDTGKALHRECGFIRINPGTNQVAFICAQNIGVVEIEEGEVEGEQLTLTSRSLSRMSFAKEPHVQQICRKFCLTAEGKLEQTVSMATSTQSLAPHLHVTYRKLSS
ncbi:THAP domain-containing 4 [Pelobates cultripes]|uniref:THAP domain-containing 4 n=1 Tax=Pelobates cultripes TaxID=61616 RepID=A0AAD1RB22_PELCU|nr:THAP domain-containing 4 [Pelobates cultripes]